MRYVLFGLATLLLLLPRLGAEDKPPPAEQVKAVLEEFAQAREKSLGALRAVKTAEERRELVKQLPNARDYAKRLLAIAEKCPKTDAAFDAYRWAVTNQGSGGGGVMILLPVAGAAPREGARDDTREAALKALLRDFGTDKRLGALCAAMRAEGDQEFLRAVLARNPHDGVKAHAALALAQSLGSQVATARRVRGNRDTYLRSMGKERVEKLAAQDDGKLLRESEELFQRAVKHAAGLSTEELVKQCQVLELSRDKGPEVFLNAVLEDGKEAEARGAAAMALGARVKSRVDLIRTLKGASGDRLQRYVNLYGKEDVLALQAEDANPLTEQVIELFELIQEKYADFKDARGKTYGERAKAELFELDKLAVGKVAPEIEGEDIDARPFKLSDYRGKVVLLDFWGHW